MRPNAPAGWFELLLDEGQTSGGQGLPESFRAVYGGDWVLPDDRPYVYVNFVTARDGRVSFDDPGHAGGGDVSGFDAHDQWLMGLLRSRADAVMMGDGTLASEPEHLWTAEYVCPSDAEAFGALRRGEARRAVPLTVFVSLTGDLPWDAAVFADPSADTLIATTNGGAGAVERAAPKVAGSLDVLALGDDEVDLGELADTLEARFGVQRLLCEGGPRLYGALLRARLGHDEFVTLSPIVIGDAGGGPRRPSIVEGVRFGVDEAPRSRLVSVRRAGDHLFLRSCYPGASA
ncbi:MAG: deaminase [Actinobacteria bacterium]|nr:MAG: deaminase [Actinomycetota bacterium]